MIKDKKKKVEQVVLVHPVQPIQIAMKRNEKKN